MLSWNRGLLLLRQCAAAQQWSRQCCWMGISFSSTSAFNVVAGGSTVIQQAGSGISSNSSSSQSSQSSRSLPPGHQYLHLTFDQLHDNIQQSLSLENAQSEMKLRVLIDKASTAEQLQATVAVLRHNYMKRCRLQHVEQFGPEVLHELWRAGKKANLGSDFALQLLQQANSLGVKTSLGLCEEAIRSCLKQNDYLAASRAWLYTKAYCSTQVPGPSAAAGDAEDAELAKGAAKAGSHRGASWASKNLIRLYLSGMTEWLKQGGLGPNHQRRLKREIKQLVQELAARGANVAWVDKVMQEVEKRVGSAEHLNEDSRKEAAQEPTAA